MKQIRRLSGNRALSLFLCVTILWTTSCSKGQKNNSIVAKSSLSGEQMFREIFLLQGENLDQKIPAYSSILSVLNSKTDDEKAAKIKIDDEIIASIKTSSPDFFDQLKSTVASKNLYQIKTLIAQGGDLILNALKADQKYGALVQQAETSAASLQGKYDLNNKADVKKFSDEVENSVTHSTSMLQTQSIPLQPRSDCVAGAVTIVVAFAVWEVVAIVNVVGIATVFVEAAAVNAVKCKAPISAASEMDGLTNDQIAVSVSQNY